MLALPVASAAGLTPVGGFRMFAEPVEYRVDVEVRVERGPWLRVPKAQLLPHVGRGAKRTLAHTDRHRLGGAQARLLGGGLDDLADLACALRPEATHARAAIDYRSSSRTAPESRSVTVECDRGGV